MRYGEREVTNGRKTRTGRVQIDPLSVGGLSLRHAEHRQWHAICLHAESGGFADLKNLRPKLYHDCKFVRDELLNVLSSHELRFNLGLL